MTLPEFAIAIIQYCAATKASVTSWYRTAQRNREVGGKATSSHLTAMATDLKYDTRQPPKIEVAQAIAKKLGLYVHRESDHDHVRPL